MEDRQDYNDVRTSDFSNEIQNQSSSSSKDSNKDALKCFINYLKTMKYINDFFCAKCLKYFNKNLLSDRTTLGFLNQKRCLGSTGGSTGDNSNNCLQQILEPPLAQSSKNITSNPNLKTTDNSSINEPDLADFTLPQQNHEYGLEISDSINSENCILTKTNDISKIKGWKKKKFCIDKNGRENKNCSINANVTSVSVSSENISSADSIEECLVEDQQLKNKFKDAYCIDELEKKCYLLKAKEDPLKDFHNLYSQLLHEDITYQTLLMKNNEKQNDKGIFKSDILNDYLNNSFFADQDKTEKAADFTSTDLFETFCGERSDRNYITVYGKKIMIESSVNISPVSKSSNYSNNDAEESNINEKSDQEVSSAAKSSNDLDTFKNMNPIDLDFITVKEVEKEITKILEKQETFKSQEIPYDLDILKPISNKKYINSKLKRNKVKRGIKRLINGTLADDRLNANDTKTLCDNEQFLKGCLCKSLNGKFTDKHCSKPECISECFCTNKPNSAVQNVLADKNWPILPKEESSWNQAIICKNNQIILINRENGICKQQKVLDPRYHHNVPLDNKMTSSVKVSVSKQKDDISEKYNNFSFKCDMKPKIQIKYLTDGGTGCVNHCEEETKKNMEVIVKGLHSQLKCNKDGIFLSSLKTPKQKISKCSIVSKISKKDSSKLDKMFDQNISFNLADVFIWCSIHSQFSCNCCGKIVFLKHSKILWKSSAECRYLSSKHMPKITINNNFPSCHVFNTDRHCSRTFGSIIDYKMRNRSAVFKLKRVAEINHHVLSNSNSFIKFKNICIELPYEQVMEKHKTNAEKIDKKKQLNINANNDEISQILDKKEVYNEEEKLCLKGSNMTPLTENQKVRPLQMEEMLLIQRPYENDSTNLQEMSVTSTRNSLYKKIDEYTLIYKPIGLNLNDKLMKRDKPSFEYGLVCLTSGFGYLLVKDYTPEQIKVQDPLHKNIFHSYKDLDAANEWLNRFFKDLLVFESPEINLKWNLVKIDLLKNLKPFDKSLIELCSKYVNADGILVDNLVTSSNLKMEESTISKRQLNGQELIKRALGGSIENRYMTEIVPSKKAKMSCSLREEEHDM